MIEGFIFSDHLKIVLILTVGLILASVLGYITNRVKLSPILGYLLAGYFIGPYSPGFVADYEISKQLAEIGVILMMFGVGLHVRWRELYYVKSVAIFGSIAQTSFTTLFGATIAFWLGWPVDSALIFGFSMGVASTVVLVRVLSDNNLHNTKVGHIALSWLICEDFIAVFALLLLPIIAEADGTHDFVWQKFLASFFMVFAKFALWVIILFTIGRKLFSIILGKVSESKSHELFTLAILSITFAIAIGTIVLTGASIALGAFVAGMVIRQTAFRQQVANNLLPLRDLFVVVFFLSIGMLFNPIVIADNLIFFLCSLGIILFGKSIAAILITRVMKYSIQASVTVALALAQIGEFSFILAEEASKLKIFSDDVLEIIVACAFVSLALNPFLFRILMRFMPAQNVKVC